MANKIMNLIPNGVIIQGLNAPADFMTKVKYSGVNAYYHNPLLQIKDSDCNSISEETFHKLLDDGCYQILEFISDKDIFIRYVSLCKKRNIPIRALFVESEYGFERWTDVKIGNKRLQTVCNTVFGVVIGFFVLLALYASTVGRGY